jgi:hypothetical protein
MYCISCVRVNGSLNASLTKPNLALCVCLLVSLFVCLCILVPLAGLARVPVSFYRFCQERVVLHITASLAPLLPPAHRELSIKSNDPM